MAFAISWPKMVQLPWNEKQTYRLNSRPQMWPLGLNFAITLTLNFQDQIKRDASYSDSWPWLRPFGDQGEVLYKDLPDSDRGDLWCRRAVDSSSSSLIFGALMQSRHSLIAFAMEFISVPVTHQHILGGLDRRFCFCIFSNVSLEFQMVMLDGGCDRWGKKL